MAIVQVLSRILLVALVVLLHGFLASVPSAAQAISEAIVRGSDVSILGEPKPDAERVAVVQRGDRIRITGDAENESGEVKPVTVNTLGVSRDWFVPVEVVATGAAGWIPEQFISPRGITTAPTDSPAPTFIPTSLPDTVHGVTPTRAPTATPVSSTSTPTSVTTQGDAAPLSPTQVPPDASVTPWPRERGLVTDAVARNTGDCTDGIGSTALTDDLFRAGLSGTGDAFQMEHVACVGDDPSGTQLYSQCSADAEGPMPDTFVIYCRVEVTNAENGPLSIGADQFWLASDSGVYAVDERLSATVPAHVDISSSREEIGTLDTVIGVVGFVMPLDQRDQAFVLIWDGPETEPVMILLEEREPSMLEFLEATPLGPANTSEPAPTSTPTFMDQWLAEKEVEAAYLDAIAPIVERVSKSLRRNSDLLESPRFGDAAWEALLQDEVDIWIAAYAEAMALVPPEAFSGAHREYLLGLSYLVDAGNEFMPAVRALDPEGIERANDLMKEANRHTLRAIELFEQYDLLGAVAP